MTTHQVLTQSKKYHLQQAAQFMRGTNARKAKRHFVKAAEVDLALKLRREIRQVRKGRVA